MTMGDTDWRPGPNGARTERRIPKPQPVEFYALENWDGTDGRTNRPTGFIVSKKELAEQWVKDHPGASYKSMQGVLVSRLEDIPDAQGILARQKALAKLSEADKKALGLA